MNGTLLLALSSVCLAVAYIFYGRWIAKSWGIDISRKTPAHELNDGIDYVPTKRSVVFGHQFASIAGAGPINGPIIAAMFGWVPVLLWILLGGIFIGAVQDFAAMYASVKNKGRSIGYIIELHIGKTGKKLFLGFVWLFSILVIAAFADIVAGTFNGFLSSGDKNSANAAVATTSILFMVAAVGLGFLIRRTSSNMLQTSTAIILLIICISMGFVIPVFMTQQFWLYSVFIYIFIASVAPVWALLQPRDYLNAFLLVAMVVCGFVGVIVNNPTMNLVPFAGFEVNGNHLFPILFVTVACGAVSGFHALVSSGTASKQIDNERDILPVSFGSMLIECLLAVLALIAVGALAVGGTPPSETPPVVFANAVSGFLTTLGLPQHVVFTLITLSISAFALTSLDSVARVGRLAFQEFFINDESERVSLLMKILTDKYVATTATLTMGYLLALRGYRDIWALFGSANQLLAALTLIACAVFLKKTKRRGFILYIPFAFMLVVTFTALGMTILKLISKIPNDFVIASDGLQFILAILLSILGVLVAVQGVMRLKRE